ncbi:SDR family oxidoreductase [Burkholderia sp. AU30198]|uniref:Short chain dehydrogenase/reductase n=1 Tax=Burkholderia aenigmatica TaxID=2015348 RepID=A0ABY6XK80_9BURK|nr:MULTISPECIES: SDR family oxidoreductase [Burkholderia]MCA8293864.1 SDR family oxidoreductase [Burkholderia sp. AU30198]VWC51832.1 short chain dehydrogenase/reductase [Burkholderia aenigmatica]VWD03630.1 short chain dehydrogenase/reductase [Burkholderia aenigmatica]
MSHNRTGRLAGKVAVVTGAASGIGRSIALRFANEGASVVATTSRNTAQLDETCRLARDGVIVARQADAGSAEQVEALIDFVEHRFGRLDVMCNNAGVIREALLVDTTEADWDAVLDVNLKGVFLGCKYAIPAMIRAGGGSIVNIGSTSSFVGEPLHAAYCASKGGVLMLTRCAAIEHAKDRIRANAVCPGWIDTPMNTPFIDALGGRGAMDALLGEVQPLGMGTPEQVADVALFLASDESSFVTGTSILVDGGLTAR